MRLTRFGHAALLVEHEGARVLIDPGAYSTRWHDLVELDAVLVTHAHHDHFDQEHITGLAASNPKAPIVAHPAVCSLLPAGIAHRAIEPGESFDVGGIRVNAVGGLHALVHDRIPRIPNLGLVLETTGGPRVFHPGDAYDFVPPSIDVLALPLTSPWSTAASTADFLLGVHPGLAFPIHDSGASELGRATFMRIIGGLLPTDIELPSVGPLETVPM